MSPHSKRRAIKRKLRALWKRVRYPLEGLLVALLSRTIPLLPRKWLVRLANGAGTLAFHLAGRERRIALANLNVAFGEAKSADEKRWIARSSFQNFARSILGLFWVRRLTAQTFSAVVEVDEETQRLIERHRARGKGIIFVTLHYGEWEILGLATAMVGFPMTVVSEQARNPHVGNRLEQLRSRTGNRLIPQWFAVPKLYKSLKRGECVAVLVDLNALPSRGAVWLNFFGKPVLGFSPVAGLATRTGASVIGGCAHPLPNGRVRIVYGPVIPSDSSGDEETDLRVINQRCLDFCEDVIRAHPEHWFWFYKRWNWRPTADNVGFPFYSRDIAEAKRPRAPAISNPQTTSVPQQSGP